MTPLIIELNEADLEESFVRGSGPGGQKINKTANCVQLLHKPTGIRVECQETRSLEYNRKIARKRLIRKLDWHYNGWQSKEGLELRKAQRSKAKMAKRSREKHQQGTLADENKAVEVDKQLTFHMRDLTSKKE